MNNKKITEFNLLRGKKFLILLIIITMATIVVGCKKGEKTNNVSDTNVENNDNNENLSNKYYTRDLTKNEKENIITEIEKNETYELVDTYNVDKIIENYHKSKTLAANVSIKINKLIKFKEKNSNKGIILADMTYYGEFLGGNYAPNRPNIVDANGNAIDTSTILSQSGYINNGNPNGLPYEYITVSAELSLGTKISNLEVGKTKTDVYQYYNVDNVENIDLKNLYIYYVTNTATDKLKINNNTTSYKNQLYTPVSLKTSNNSIPSNITEYFRNEVSVKNELDSIGNIYNKEGKTINKAYIATALLSSYKVERWKNRDVLIVNYKFDTDEEDAYAYSNFDPYGSSFAFYLTDSHGKVYKPIKIADDKTLIKVSDGHEIVFVLPDTFEGNEWYLTERTTGLYILGERINVQQLTRVD